MTESYLATGFFTKNLFSANPTIIIDKLDPILQDFETSPGDETDETIVKIKDVPKVVVPLTNVQKVKALVPK